MEKDALFQYNESQAQVGYKSAVLYKKQGDTKYRFLAASETVPFPYGTKDTFEFDLLNSASKGMVDGKSSLEQKEVKRSNTRQGWLQVSRQDFFPS